MRDPLRVWTAAASTVAAIAALWAAYVAKPPAQSAPRADIAPVEVRAEAPVVASSTPAAPTPAAQPQDPDAFPALPELGQSEGLPDGGHLHRGTRLPSGEGRIIRNPDTAFGTREMIQHLDAALATVHRKHPRAHRVLIGDLSHEVGGQLPGHRSHQSGRDVDVGFLYRNRSGPGLRIFEDASRDNLHFRATFTLLKALAASHDEPGGMQWGLLDYEVQRLLVQWARRNDVATKEELDVLFQYPKGAYAPAGLYRHYPNHRDHVHVRYGCPPDDPHCASPMVPPARPPKLGGLEEKRDLGR